MKTRSGASPKKQTSDKSIFNLPWRDAKRLKKKKGFMEVVEQVHYTFGWQRAGEVAKAVLEESTSRIGQYRKKCVSRKCIFNQSTFSLNGVPVAVGSVKVLPNMYILEDQPCIHVDAEVETIVFRYALVLPIDASWLLSTRDTSVHV